MQHVLSGIPKTDEEGNPIMVPGLLPPRPVEKWDRLLGCGRRRITPAEQPWITVRGDGDRAWYEGVLTCSLFWPCPACSASIRAERAREIEKAAARWLGGWDQPGAQRPYRGREVLTTEDGGEYQKWAAPRVLRTTKDGAAYCVWKDSRPAGSLAFLTLTLRHTKDQRLSDLLGFVMKAWRAMMGGRSRQRLRDAGVAHFIRATEVTYGDRHGWHPHLHVLLFLDRPAVSDAGLGLLEGMFYAAWAAQVDKAGLGSIRGSAGKKHSVRIDRVTKAKGLAEYLSKVTGIEGGKASPLGMEMARGDLKNGRKVRGEKDRAYRTHNPLEIVDLVGEHRAGVECGRCGGGDSECKRYTKAIAVLREYAEATKGRRAIEWSKGLRGTVEVTETPDEVVAAEGYNRLALALLGCLGDRDWGLVLRFKAQADVLAAAEEGGSDGLWACIADLAARAEHLDAARATARPVA